MKSFSPILCLLLFALPAHAEDPAIVEEAPVVEEAPISEEKVDSEAKEIKIESSGIAGSFGFGAGIGVNAINGSHVVSAIEVNGAVNVSDSESTRMQLWLEGHYLFGGDFVKYQCKNGCKVLGSDNKEREVPVGGSYYRDRRFYHGPFFAVQVGDNNSLINGASLGYMLSFKKSSSGNKDRYFNIGLGYSVAKVQTLGNVKDGDTLNDGDQILLKQRTQEGVLLLFSVNIF